MKSFLSNKLSEIESVQEAVSAPISTFDESEVNLSYEISSRKLFHIRSRTELTEKKAKLTLGKRKQKLPVCRAKVKSAIEASLPLCSISTFINKAATLNYEFKPEIFLKRKIELLGVPKCSWDSLRCQAYGLAASKENLLYTLLAKHNCNKFLTGFQEKKEENLFLVPKESAEL